MRGEIAPDVRIPQDDRVLLESEITREYLYRKHIVSRGVDPTAVDARQHEANYNDLLAHWPDGRMRYVAHQAVDKFATLELPAITQRATTHL